MPRPSAMPSNALSAAVLTRRGGRPQRAVVDETGIPDATLSRVERGRMPSYPTALALARWLGWTVEQVMEAAEKPAALKIDASDP
jgi:transcriptional regulator with XRE-family HTH domain